MSLTTPDALLLLLILLPAVAVIGWPRLRYRRRRDAAALVLRLVLVTLIVLGLAGVRVQRTADKLAVVFLIDVSDSVAPELQSAAVRYVREAAQAMKAEDQAAMVVFGADALVETPITDRLELVQIGSDPVRLNTDLAEAMRVGLALFPADTAKRMVILSDGRQTVGDAEQVARLAAASSVQIEYVALTPDTATEQVAQPEVLIAGVDVPATVNEGERFTVTASLTSNRPSSLVEVRVLSGGQVIERREVELPLGTTNEAFELIAPVAGFVDFTVVVEPRGADTFYQNNQLSAFTEVAGSPRVLLVTSDSREVDALSQVLSASGLRVDVLGPRDLPIGLAPLSSYDCIVLANVSAADLTADRIRYLQAYVRDLGGGLVAIGGPNSYGVGGYFATPLEETLPVDVRLKDQKRIPQLTLLFVIDRSGSMEVASGGSVSNLELAKEAVVRSFDLLNDTDRTGVLSFDVSAYYVVPIQDVGDALNRQRMRDLVGSLRSGGGTSIRQGIQSADEVLRGDPSELKHVILLTDGGADQSGIIPAVTRMYQNYGITTSVVAVGQQYVDWLSQVAAAGHGKFHLAYDVSTIPAIFTAETLLATRSYISEERFVPALAARHPIVEGFASLPALDGYIASTAKENATVIVLGPQDDPILAAWQYGLGRAVAFTSDASSRWAGAWIDWEGYADFWNQAVRWAIVSGNTDNVELRVSLRGEQAVLIADVRDNQGRFLNGLQLDASVVTSRLDQRTLSLQQMAPGRYEAVFTPTTEGAYFITVAGGTTPGAAIPIPETVLQTTGWVLSYSAEYRIDASEDAERGLALLRRIADLTGGGSLRDTPSAAFLHNLNQEQAAQPIWPYLLLAALLVLPVDIAVRRLVITARDVERMRAWVGRSSPRYDVPDSERMGRLMEAKDRARAQRQPRADQGAAEPQGPPVAITPEPRPTGPVKPPRPSHERSSPDAQPEESLASRLLKRRGAQQEDRDE